MLKKLMAFLNKKYPREVYVGKRLLRPLYIQWMEFRFARQYRVSLRLMYGGYFDTYKNEFRRDPYQLSGLSLRRNLFKKRLAVNTLIIIRSLRFSNSLMQLCNVLIVGQKLKVKHILLPAQMWYLKDNFSINGIQFSKFQSITQKPDEVTLSGMFFFTNTLEPDFKTPNPKYYELLSKYKEHMVIGSSQDKPDFDLVIHIRAGDVFGAYAGDVAYGQPPLAYYKKILKAFTFRKVAIVFEDMGNPVIPHVIEFARQRCEQVVEYSGTLQEDLDVLLSAKNIVVGVGTFLQGVLAISDHIVNVFCFHGKFKDWGTPLNIIDVVDTSGEYISKVMSRNWTNSREQRNLMLTHQESVLEIIGELK